ncbi:uncharacterized protein LOC132040151 isoform X2 [Lycium ferocissimum]|uniref:uncharacterized protein LOC132040151 isoform X2 n=1 Tax=Lycium ferocissimum TaxID=112874 RepID=UPI0028168E5D|nr:uncharacterized protein LOC132040151 isoform X2 [Lycium ferocissimum]
MRRVTTELTRLTHILEYLSITPSLLVPVHFDSKATIHIGIRSSTRGLSMLNSIATSYGNNFFQAWVEILKYMDKIQRTVASNIIRSAWKLKYLIGCYHGII